MNGFALHPQLQADTHLLISLKHSEVLLMDDARFPWLILVPRIVNARELHELAPAVRAQVSEEVYTVSTLLSQHTKAYKMNIGALGNMVEQLHIHVIARQTDDAVWPNPVWGAGTRKPYTLEQKSVLKKEYACLLYTSPSPRDS